MTIQIPIPWLTLVEDEDRDRRYALCKSCEKFTQLKTCEVCSCVMPVKVCWADAECPEGKWQKVPY